jgi:hypothetical protein
VPRVREVPHRITHSIHVGVEALTHRAHLLIDDPAMILRLPRPRSPDGWSWEADPDAHGRHERNGPHEHGGGSRDGVRLPAARQDRPSGHGA